MLNRDRLERELPEFNTETKKALNDLGFDFYRLNGLPFLDIAGYHKVPDLKIPYTNLASSDLITHSVAGEVAVSSDPKLFILHDTPYGSAREQQKKAKHFVAALRNEAGIASIVPAVLTHSSWLDLVLGITRQTEKSPFDRVPNKIFTRTSNDYAFGYFIEEDSVVQAVYGDLETSGFPLLRIVPFNKHVASSQVGLALVIA